jgi:hypothetical protein
LKTALDAWGDKDMDGYSNYSDLDPYEDDDYDRDGYDTIADSDPYDENVY